MIFRVAWQRSVEYRVDFFVHLIRGLIGLMVMLLIFRSVFTQQPNFLGYSFSSMFTYLIMARVFHFTGRGNTARDIAQEIKEGQLSVYLLKPISYLRYWLSVFCADRLFEMIIRFSLIFVFLIFFPGFFSFPPFSTILVLALFLFLALAFNYLFNLFMASLAFWVTDIRLFGTFVGLVVGFLGGEVLPLDVLPAGLKNIAFFLPFQYTLYFPIQIYQEKLPPEQILKGFFFMLAWIGFFCLLVLRLWRKGVKKYEAIGQ